MFAWMRSIKTALRAKKLIGDIQQEVKVAEEQGKSPLYSKTVWINVFALIAIGVQKWTGHDYLDAETQAALVVVVNLVLRAVTKKPLTLTGPSSRAWILVPLVLFGWPGTSQAQSLPDNVCATLTQERAKLTAPLTKPQLAELLDRVAWQHRGDGWGLLSKPTGNNCPMPTTNAPVSCDYLVRAGVGWDVLSDSDGVAKPECGDGVQGMTGWVAPVDPGGTPAPPPPPPSGGEIDLAAVLARLDLFAPQLEQARAEAYNAAVRALEIQAALKDVDAKLAVLDQKLTAHDQQPPSWVKDWKTWLTIGAGIAAGIVAATKGGNTNPAPAPAGGG